MPAEERAKVESAANSLKDSLKGDDGDAIRKNVENLMTCSQSIGKIMYEQAAQQAAASSAEPDATPAQDESAKDEKKDEDVIDAEFEVKEK